MDKDDFVFNVAAAALFVVFFVGLPLLIYCGVVEGNKYRKECEAKGGQVLEARGMRACIDPKALK